MLHEELMDSDAVREEILSYIDDKYDKRETTWQYAIASAVATKISEFAALLSVDSDEKYADTASYYTLARLMAMRGLNLKQATYSEFKMYVAPSTVKIDIKSHVQLENYDYTYEVVSKLSNEMVDNVEYAVYKIKAQIAGSELNSIISGRLLFTDTSVVGMTSCKLGPCITLGEDMEDEDAARNRYFCSFEDKRYGGNIADYQSMCSNIDGIDGCRVYTPSQLSPTETDYNIKLVLISSDNTKVSAEKVADVQELIDPSEHSGDGLGLAPIDHFVKVESVEEVKINVTADFSFLDGYTFSSCQSSISTAVTTYLNGLTDTWVDDNELNSHPCVEVKVAKLISAIVDIEGIDDVTSVKINASATGSNFMLQSNQIPMFNSVSEVVS